MRTGGGTGAPGGERVVSIETRILFTCSLATIIFRARSTAVPIQKRRMSESDVWDRSLRTRMRDESSSTMKVKDNEN